jgi:hypothetical protein
MIVRRTIIFGLIIVLAGCALTSGAGESERMLVLGSALTKLSSAAESAARYKHPPENISDAKFLSLATKHDPTLLQPFSEYAVRVLLQDRHAVVLVCTNDKTRALLEDAGCSAELDRHLWENKPARPCEFTLKVSDVCAEKQPR